MAPPSFVRFTGVQSAWIIPPSPLSLTAPTRAPSLGLVSARLVQLSSPAGIDKPPATSRKLSAYAAPPVRRTTAAGSVTLRSRMAAASVSPSIRRVALHQAVPDRGL